MEGSVYNNRYCLTVDEQQAVVTLYQTFRDETLTSLGRRFEVSGPTIGDTLRRHDVEVRRAGGRKKGNTSTIFSRLTTDEKARICEAYKTKTLTEISEVFGFSTTTASSILQKLGVTMRHQGVRTKDLVLTSKQKSILEDFKNPTISNRQITQKYSVGRNYARRLARKWGVTGQRAVGAPAKLTPTTRTALLHDYATSSLSISELTVKYGVSKHYIYQKAAKYKIKRSVAVLSQLNQLKPGEMPAGRLKDGYMRVNCPAYHSDLTGRKRGSKMARSNLVMEQYLGRRLEFGWEAVHHCNGDKLNDSLDNLELVLQSGVKKYVSEHTLYHLKKNRSENHFAGDFSKMVEALKQNNGVMTRSANSLGTTADILQHFLGAVGLELLTNIPLDKIRSIFKKYCPNLCLETNINA